MDLHNSGSDSNYVATIQIHVESDLDPVNLHPIQHLPSHAYTKQEIGANNALGIVSFLTGYGNPIKMMGFILVLSLIDYYYASSFTCKNYLLVLS